MKVTEKKFLSPADVSELFGFTEKTLANFRWARKGPAYLKLGNKKVLYQMKDIEKWIDTFGTKIETINQISEI